MKKHMMTMFAAMVMTAGPGGRAAKAEQNLIAKVPFEFRVGAAVLQPGPYLIVTDNCKLIVRHARGEQAAIAMVTRGRGRAGSSLVFNRVAGRYFLSSIHYNGDLTQLQVTGEERLLRERNETPRVAFVPLGRVAE